MVQQNTTDITEWQFCMHLGLYAQQSGTDRVASWLRSETSRLVNELGREPLRHELAHAIKNANYAYMIGRSSPSESQTESYIENNNL